MRRVSVNQADQMPVPEELIERAVCHVLEVESVAECDVSVTFLPDSEIRALNAEYLGHDWATDVLSFALEPDPGTPTGTVAGDVYIGAARAQSQAQEHEVAPEAEAVRLAVHGTLHLLGFDHPEDDRDTSPFFAKQEALVEQVLAGWRG